MQVAQEQGPLLTWLARLVGSRRAVEVGTFTGLSALCIAQAPTPTLFVVIDADKTGYRSYYEILLPLMRPGGVILFDNALYFGAVLTDSEDAAVVAIKALNDHVAGDLRVESVLLNVGDGLLMARSEDEAGVSRASGR